MSGFNLGDIVAHLKVEMGNFTDSLNKAKQQINSTATNMSKIEQAGQSLTKVGGIMTASLTAPIMAFGAAAVKTSMEFESSMANVQALSGATGSELEQLSSFAREMGATTVFSASECADALGYMALAGWDTQQSMSALPGVLNLAASSGMDLAQASDMVTDYLSAFGMKAEEAGRMADVLAKAQANSNTTTEMLGEAFKNCAVNANAFGLDVEQTTALLGKLADQGLKGSEAGTALNAVFRDMSSKMEDGAIKIGNTNVAITDAQGNFRSMADIVRDVTKATDGMSESEKMVALQSTFTADSIKAMGILMNTGADDIDAFTEALYNSEGTAEEMANIMNQDLNGTLKMIGSAFQELQLQIGDALLPILHVFGAALIKLIQWFTNLPGPIKTVIGVLAVLLAAVGPVLLIVGQLMTNFNKLRTAFLIVKAVIMDSLIPALGTLWAFMLANPITFVIALVAALVAAFIYLWNNCEGFRQFWIDLWNQCKQAITDWYNHNKATIDSVIQFFSAAWEAIKTIFSGFITFLKGVFTGDMETACNGLKQIWEGVKMWFGNIWNAMKTLLSTAVSSMISTIKRWGSNAVNTIKSACTNMINSLKTWVSNMASKAKEGANKFISTITSTLKSLPSKMISIGKSICEGIASGIKQGLSWVSNACGSIVNTVTGALKGIKGFNINSPSKLMRDEVGSSISEGIAVGMEKNVGFITKAAKNVKDLVMDSMNVSGLTNGLDLAGLKNSLSIQTSPLATSAIQGYNSNIGNRGVIEQSVDYNKMADTIAKSVHKAIVDTPNNIYMDKTVVGMKVAYTVQEKINIEKNRLDRLEGKFDK